MSNPSRTRLNAAISAVVGYIERVCESEGEEDFSPDLSGAAACLDALVDLRDPRPASAVDRLVPIIEKALQGYPLHRCGSPLDDLIRPPAVPGDLVDLMDRDPLPNFGDADAPGPYGGPPAPTVVPVPPDCMPQPEKVPPTPDSPGCEQSPVQP